jgi:hypothetical protein
MYRHHRLKPVPPHWQPENKPDSSLHVDWVCLSGDVSSGTQVQQPRAWNVAFITQACAAMVPTSAPMNES